jgi:hypothetical protein
MEVLVLTINSELESASKLGYKTSTYLGDFAHKFDNKIVIRWGNSRWLYNVDATKHADFKNVLNSAECIRRNCEKAKATKLMSLVVNVPTLWEKSVPKDVLAVVRPHEHSSGHGFSVKKGPFKVEPGTYAARYLDVTKEGAEYRVWFCGNKTMCGRRHKMECNPDEQWPCRSMWGYTFVDGISKELHNSTLLAAKKIGLEFGAADVLFYKGKWYFLELNSAASLDHRLVREFFQTNLKLLIEKKFPKVQQTLIPVVEVVKPTEEIKKKELERNVTELVV